MQPQKGNKVIEHEKNRTTSASSWTQKGKRKNPFLLLRQEQDSVPKELQILYYQRAIIRVLSSYLVKTVLGCYPRRPKKYNKTSWYERHL